MAPTGWSLQGQTATRHRRSEGLRHRSRLQEAGRSNSEMSLYYDSPCLCQVFRDLWRIGSPTRRHCIRNGQSLCHVRLKMVFLGLKSSSQEMGKGPAFSLTLPECWIIRKMSYLKTNISLYSSEQHSTLTKSWLTERTRRICHQATWHTWGATTILMSLLRKSPDKVGTPLELKNPANRDCIQDMG